MSRPKAKTIFYSVVIGGVTFFILETSWIPPEIKVIMSFVGGICVGGAIEQNHSNYWDARKTISQVEDKLNRTLSGQKSVSVTRLLTLLEEMKDKAD
jgi:hypothetical protein